MARLRIKREGKEEEVVSLSGDIVTLGRSSEATIPIEDHGASRKHAQIERIDGGHKLVDLESRNGTRVNGAHVNQHLLQVGDEVQIGKTILVYEAGDSELLPEPKPESSAAAAAVAGVSPPRVHITRRRTSAIRRGGHGAETKVLIAIVGVSVTLGLVAFLHRPPATMVEAKNHLGGAKEWAKKGEALYREDRTADVIKKQIGLFEEAKKEYDAIPSNVDEYYRQAQDDLKEIERKLKDLKEDLPRFRAQEIRDFAKGHPAEVEGLKKLVEDFKRDFPVNAEGAKLEQMVKDLSTAKPEDLGPVYTAIEADVETSLAANQFGKALKGLQEFANKHPTSALAAKAEDRIKEVQAKAGEFWTAEQKKAQEAAKAGKKEDAIQVYQHVIAACGDESLLSDFVLQAKSEMKQLQDKK